MFNKNTKKSRTPKPEESAPKEVMLKGLSKPWKLMKSTSRKRYYYFNVTTGESVWKIPGVKADNHEDESLEVKTLADDNVVVKFEEEKDGSWRNSYPDLADKLRFALCNSKFADVRIIIENGDDKQCFPAHRTILALQSPFFEKIFFGENSPKEVSIERVKPSVFSSFLKYMYSDDSPISLLSAEELLDLWQLSLKFLTDKLTEIVKKELVVKLNSNHSIAMPMLQMAVHVHDMEIKKTTLRIIVSEANVLINETSFSTLDEKAAKLIMSQGSLNISEVSLWDVMLKWGEAQCEKKGWSTSPSDIRLVISGLINEIRFLDMDISSFSVGPETSGILKQDVCLAIRRKLSHPTSYFMPSPFSASKRVRLCLRCKEIHCVHFKFNNCSGCNVAHCTVLEPTVIVDCANGCRINHCIKSFAVFGPCDCNLNHCDNFRTNVATACAFCKFNHCVNANVVCAKCSVKHCRKFEANVTCW